MIFCFQPIVKTEIIVLWKLALKIWKRVGAHITGIQISPPDYVYDIVLESDGIAPFIWLDFRLGSNIEAIFSDDEFVTFSNKKLIQFYGQNPVSIDKLKSQLTVKSLTDIKSE
jgi:hypothetical protein